MIFQLDQGIKTFWAGATGLSLGTGPINSDVIIASNSWAYRNRIKQKGSLVFPFANYRVLPGGIVKPEKTFPKNYATAINGMWDDDIGARVKCMSFTARYEGTFWATSFTNTMFVFQELFENNYTDNVVDYTYNINGTNYTFQAPIEFSNLALDPQWEEQTEIDKGNIHSIDISFEISAFLFVTKTPLGSNSANYTITTPCVITSVAHGLTTRDRVVVGGSTNGDIDGNWRVTVIDADHFSLDNCNNTGTGKVAGTCQWYSGVAPVNQLEVELFYSNGVIDGSTPDRTFTTP